MTNDLSQGAFVAAVVTAANDTLAATKELQRHYPVSPVEVQSIFEQRLAQLLR